MNVSKSVPLLDLSKADPLSQPKLQAEPKRVERVETCNNTIDSAPVGSRNSTLLSAGAATTASPASGSSNLPSVDCMVSYTQQEEDARIVCVSTPPLNAVPTTVCSLPSNADLSPCLVSGTAQNSLDARLSAAGGRSRQLTFVNGLEHYQVDIETYLSSGQYESMTSSVLAAGELLELIATSEDENPSVNSNPEDDPSGYDEFSFSSFDSFKVTRKRLPSATAKRGAETQGPDEITEAA